jgi:hypothetical protein
MCLLLVERFDGLENCFVIIDVLHRLDEVTDVELLFKL